eukprot:TRINITY_DN19818_c0_g1_i1.p1 TRINITY_DN19818_c0_g1~~TRINITY_DN19818_c0_g1_i1.p1  ORF type:complete len:128 (-),score=33.84 TRINITY_DN19818_c0_g1_i1:890-1273(-)
MPIRPMMNDEGQLPADGLFPKKRAAFRALRGSPLRQLSKHYKLDTTGTDETGLKRLCAHASVPARSFDEMGAVLTAINAEETAWNIRSRRLLETLDAVVTPTPNRSGVYPPTSLFPEGTTIKRCELL